jgi:2-oxo-4-hydroxy-4-carboxy--5-ureidoimidazoline (OHCU) decarboxylase
MSLPSMAQLDAAPRAVFLDAIAPLFERAPRFLEMLAEYRPFGSWAELFREARTVALHAPRDVQKELLEAHPRIGAPPSSVSALSFREQGYDREQEEAVEALAPLNDAYERRFGFRYVVFVAGRSRSEIVPLLRAALEADPDGERERGLGDVVEIARARATELGVIEDDPASLFEARILGEDDDR